MTETTNSPATLQIPGQRPADEVTARAVAAYFRAWTTMISCFSAGSCAESDDVLRLRTGLPVAPFNGVWSTQLDVSDAAVLAAVDDFLGGDLPWNLQLRPGSPAGLDDALAARGLVRTAQIPFMVQRQVPTGSPSTRMRRTETFVDVDSTLALLEQGFGMPPELTRQGFPVSVLFMSGATTWIASSDATDVSTALSVVDGDLCGVFNVATPPEHRGHGHGGDVTAHATAASGASAAYLQASPMGLPVYERLGFRTSEHWQQWMPAEYA